MTYRYLDLTAPVDTRQYNWIEVGWLKRWIAGEQPLGPINNTPLLCPHGSVNLDHTNRKRISTVNENFPCSM